MNIYQLEERINENPHSPLSARLAAQYVIRGKVQEALKLSIQCIQQNPDYATPYMILGRCYAAIHRYDAALLCAEKSIRLQNDSTISHTLMNIWKKLLSQSLESQITSLPEPLTDLNSLEQFLRIYDFVEESIKTEESLEDNLQLSNAVTEVQNSNEPPELPKVDEEILLKQENEVQIEHTFVNHANLENLQNNPTDLEKNISEGEFELEMGEETRDKSEKENIISDKTVESDEFQIGIVEPPIEKEMIEKLQISGEAQDLGEIKQELTQEDFFESQTSTISENEIAEFNSQQVIISNNEINPDLDEKNKFDNEIVKEENAQISDDRLKSKKSDEHLEKILSSLQRTLSQESQLQSSDFNIGPKQDLPQIVSQTLAEIYEKQGEFEEAIKTYRLLISQRPKQREYFEKKIIELETKLKLRI